MEDLEVALRLAQDEQFGSKFKSAVESRFFWLYSFSLWNAGALWKCLASAFGYSLVGAGMLSLPGTAISGPSDFVFVAFCFLMGLVWAWAVFLESWVRPTNLRVIMRLAFYLSRTNKSLDLMSLNELRVLFPRRHHIEPTLTFERYNELRSVLTAFQLVSAFFVMGVLATWVAGVALKSPGVYQVAPPGTLSAFVFFYILMTGMFVPSALASYANKQLVRRVRPDDRHHVEAELLEHRPPLRLLLDTLSKRLQLRD